MGLFYNHTNDVCQLIVWKIEEPISFFSCKLRLSPEENVKVSSFKNEKRKLEFWVARYLLHLHNCDTTLVSYDADGKPKPIGNKSISISHCAHFVAVLVTTKGFPGVDVETISARAGKIKQRFLNDKEQDFLKDDNKLTTLFWSAKEALFKMCIRQGIDFKTQLAIEPKLLKENELLEAQILKEGRRVDIALNYKIFEEIVLVWGVNYENI